MPRPGVAAVPVTIDALDNYGRKPTAHLPTLKVEGAENPVVQVIEEASGEVVYTLRIAGRSFRPHVFAPGTYTITREVNAPHLKVPATTPTITAIRRVDPADRPPSGHRAWA